MQRNVEQLAAMQRAAAEGGETGAVYPGSPAWRSDVFRFAQDGPTDPPELDDYINQYDVALAILMGALSGAGTGATIVGRVGSLGGPALGVIGTVLGTIGGGIGGGFAARVNEPDPPDDDTRGEGQQDDVK